MLVKFLMRLMWCDDYKLISHTVENGCETI